ncbi:M56 family metallopeptidase [Streptomyces sp. NBC_00838]|uniref:M48 family metallopeptidase n=1 Tax=Streptomyces sp. NBC_00838 TaxID=2903680 RepID=UPI0038706031|nr:M56 family metallopeptidase [Streptomyces sp. NBC_00838]
MLLLMLLVTAGMTMIPLAVWQLLASSETADKEAACSLAAGIDPGWSLDKHMLQYAENEFVLDACIDRYAQDFSGVSLGVGAVAIATVVALYWLLPVWKTRRSKVVPLDAMDVHGTLRPLLDELVAIAGLTGPPRFVVAPAEVTASAVVFGRWHRPTICLDGGLIATSDTQRDRFRAVVLHELAHVRNGDVGVTYFTVALWRVFLVLVLPLWVAMSLGALFLTGTPEGRGVYAPFNTHTLVFGCLIVVAVYLTRAGILRNREIYADLMAARWGASQEPWEITAPRRSTMFARFVELWHTHPSWALRRTSLTDPKVLFGLETLPMFLTGFAADMLVWNLGSLPYSLLPVKVVLVAGLVVGIGGVVLWRAVVYALLTGRPAPSGWPVGLWLGFGVALGELIGPGAGANSWLPTHPEALLILVAALVLVMTWTAHNAEWWIRSWRGRSLDPAMVMGVTAPSLALATVLYAWEAWAEDLTQGWPFSAAGVLSTYGMPGVPPADIGPLLKVIAVVSFFPGAEGELRSLWWGPVLLWVLPLLALTIRPSVRRARWLVRALPGSVEPLTPRALGPGRLLAAGLAGGVVCWAGLAMALAHLNTPDPAAVRMTGPFQLVHMWWPVLVIWCAMALTAACVAAVTDSAWLPAGLVAAGTTGLLGAGGTYLLMRTDGCLGPFNTMTNMCRWWPNVVAGTLVEHGLTYVLSFGTLVAGLAAFAGRGAGLLWRRLGRTWRRPAAPPGAKRPPRQRCQRGARVVAVVVVAAGFGATALAVDTSAPTHRSDWRPELMLNQSRPTTSASMARRQGNAWAALEGLDHIKALSAAEKDFYAEFAPGGSTIALTPTCVELGRAVKRAEAYFPVPSPVGQQAWSDMLTRFQQLATACWDFVTEPSPRTFRAATVADQEAFDAKWEMFDWLEGSGAARRKPA